MKVSHTYYYVQSQKEGESPRIVYHTHEKKTNEYYHKFLNRKQAKSLAEAEKKITPDVKFRVVKLIETYNSDPWF